MIARTAALAAALVAATGLTACTAGEAAENAIELTASDSACELARTDLTAGTTTFAITNTGSKVTEVYVYARAGRSSRASSPRRRTSARAPPTT